MDKIYVVLIAVSALILLYILWCFIEPFFLDQDRATLKKSPDDSSPAGSITIKNLPIVQSDAENVPDFRFVFFSDTHAEWCPVSSKRICDSIRKAHETSPLDGVIFGGDMSSYKQGAAKGFKYLTAVSNCCKELGIPFYGVSGNHDIFVDNIPEQAGFVSLDDTHITLVSRTSGSKAVLAGLSDTGRKNRVWHKMPVLDGNEPIMLVVHDPDAILHFDPATRPDFMLSGHLHGGQMKFPFRIEFCVLRRHDKLPNMGAVQGVYNIGGTTVFISRGLGCGVMPFRFLSVPEVTVVEINL